MKKILVLVACLATAAALAVGGTWALSGTPVSDDQGGIKQYILKRTEQGLAPSEDSMLLPAAHPRDTQDFWGSAMESTSLQYKNTTHTVSLWDQAVVNGALDKLVWVENERPDSCYFRTILAFENTGNAFDELIHLNWNRDAGYEILTCDESAWFDQDNDGKNEPYKLFIINSNAPLAGKAIAAPSLLQVAMDGSATQEDMTAIGGSYTLLAYTQAVWLEEEEKAKGLTLEDIRNAVFDDVTTQNHPWSHLIRTN